MDEYPSSSVPDTNLKFWGAEIRYAFLEGGALTPALALRGTYTTLSGVDQLALDTRGLELSISKQHGVGKWNRQCSRTV